MWCHLKTCQQHYPHDSHVCQREKKLFSRFFRLNKQKFPFIWTQLPKVLTYPQYTTLDMGQWHLAEQRNFEMSIDQTEVCCWYCIEQILEARKNPWLHVSLLHIVRINSQRIRKYKCISRHIFPMWLLSESIRSPFESSRSHVRALCSSKMLGL